MGVEPLRAGAQRNLGRGPQRAIGAPSGDAAGPTEIRERSLSHPQILLQSQFAICFEPAVLTRPLRMSMCVQRFAATSPSLLPLHPCSSPRNSGI